MGAGGGRITSTLRLAAAIVILLASCSPDGAADQSLEDHPSFPCYTWWTASSRVAGLAGVVPYAGSVISYEEVFDLADEWVPESEAAASLQAIRDQMPDDSSSDAAWQQWEVSVIGGVYEWALFYLDVALEAVETSTDLRAEDRESLSVYVSELIGFVEDQWALSVPLFNENPRLDVTTLGVLTGTPEAGDLYQAWRDVTEDSPYDTEAGIRDASMNICGEEVLDIGA